MSNRNHKNHFTTTTASYHTTQHNLITSNQYHHLYTISNLNRTVSKTRLESASRSNLFYQSRSSSPTKSAAQRTSAGGGVRQYPVASHLFPPYNNFKSREPYHVLYNSAHELHTNFLVNISLYRPLHYIMFHCHLSFFGLSFVCFLSRRAVAFLSYSIPHP